MWRAAAQDGDSGETVVDMRPFGLETAATVAPDGIERAQRDLTKAYDVSQILAKARDGEAVFDEVIGAVFKSVDADQVALLLKADGDPASVADTVAARGRDAATRGDDIPISRTVVQHVLQNGVSIVSEDASTDVRFLNADSMPLLNIQSVLCTPVATGDETVGVLYADNRRRRLAFGARDLELLALIGNQAGAAVDRARLVAALERFFIDTIQAMVATIDAKDGYTHRHSERVAAAAVAIGRELGMDDDALETVRLSGLLHDIGKIGVPESILSKPTALTEREFAAMRQHPLHGERILQNMQDRRFQAILPGVRSHHERWDGSGYPDGLAGTDIPRLGRLIAVADALDALSSDRVYRKGLSLDATVGYIVEHAGRLFDPDVAMATRLLYARGAIPSPCASTDSD